LLGFCIYVEKPNNIECCQVRMDVKSFALPYRTV
jgi:hypothetical protein